MKKIAHQIEVQCIYNKILKGELTLIYNNQDSFKTT